MINSTSTLGSWRVGMARLLQGHIVNNEYKPRVIMNLKLNSIVIKAQGEKDVHPNIGSSGIYSLR